MSADGVKAGKAYVELSVKDRLTQGLTEAKERLTSWANGLALTSAAIQTGSLAVLGALGAAASHFADQGSQFNDMSAATGVGVEALSALSYAAKQTGVDVGALQGGLKGLAKFIGIADVLRHLSSYESHCFSINEAWITSVPVVSCDYFVNRRFEERHGPLMWLVPIRSHPAQLAAAIAAAYEGRTDARVAHAWEVASTPREPQVPHAAAQFDAHRGYSSSSGSGSRAGMSMTSGRSSSKCISANRFQAAWAK